MDKLKEFLTNIKNCTQREYSPTKEEFVHLSLVFKQTLALVLGLLAGIMQVKGSMGIIGFLVISSLVYMFYCKNYLETDEDVIENYKIFSEGMFPAFAMFILTWTVTNTYMLQTTVENLN